MSHFRMLCIAPKIKFTYRISSHRPDPGTKNSAPFALHQTVHWDFPHPSLAPLRKETKKQSPQPNTCPTYLSFVVGLKLPIVKSNKATKKREYVNRKSASNVDTQQKGKEKKRNLKFVCLSCVHLLLHTINPHPMAYAIDPSKWYIISYFYITQSSKFFYSSTFSPSFSP